MAQNQRVGFIGLGTMGWPMFGHIAAKADAAGVAEAVCFDVSDATRARAVAAGWSVAECVADLVAGVDAIHLCLPSGEALDTVCRGAGGVLSAVREGQVVVDHGTSPVDLTRQLAIDFAARNAAFVDAPITRTRAAAEAGTLVVLFGGPEEVLRRVEQPILCFAEEIAHCGDVGAGQIVKQLNNMVLFQTVAALSEALATAEAHGLAGEALFDALEKGSADSFALRNHGRKAMLRNDYPERAFSVAYAKKDLAYAIDLAEQAGIDLGQARGVADLFDRAISAGDGEAYFPVIARRYQPK
ncbi:MAG: NAD(P)-dependent oxidoreductase [Pseudomonadota bacterium]